MEKMFKELDILESFYNRNIINLEEYFKIKSSLIDSYRPKPEQNDDLPF